MSLLRRIVDRLNRIGGSYTGLFTIIGILIAFVGLLIAFHPTADSHPSLPTPTPTTVSAATDTFDPTAAAQTIVQQINVFRNTFGYPDVSENDTLHQIAVYICDSIDPSVTNLEQSAQQSADNAATSSSYHYDGKVQAFADTTPISIIDLNTRMDKREEKFQYDYGKYGYCNFIHSSNPQAWALVFGR